MCRLLADESNISTSYGCCGRVHRLSASAHSVLTASLAMYDAVYYNSFNLLLGKKALQANTYQNQEYVGL